jgi:hypothetical protein
LSFIVETNEEDELDKPNEDYSSDDESDEEDENLYNKVSHRLFDFCNFQIKRNIQGHIQRMSLPKTGNTASALDSTHPYQGNVSNEHPAPVSSASSYRTSLLAAATSNSLSIKPDPVFTTGLAPAMSLNSDKLDMTTHSVTLMRGSTLLSNNNRNLRRMPSSSKLSSGLSTNDDYSSDTEQFGLGDKEASKKSFSNPNKNGLIEHKGNEKDLLKEENQGEDKVDIPSFVSSSLSDSSGQFNNASANAFAIANAVSSTILPSSGGGAYGRRGHRPSLAAVTRKLLRRSSQVANARADIDDTLGGGDSNIEHLGLSDLVYKMRGNDKLEEKVANRVKYTKSGGSSGDGVDQQSELDGGG